MLCRESREQESKWSFCWEENVHREQSRWKELEEMAHQTELHLASFLQPWWQEMLYSFLWADQRETDKREQREDQTEWEVKKRRGYVQKNVQQHPAQKTEIMGQMAGG